MSAPILFSFSRPNIEARNYEPFLRWWGRDALPEGAALAASMGRLSFFVDGYNDVPDEVYTIPAIREFYAGLNEVWPYWLFFCDLRGESLQMIAACLMRNVSSRAVRGAPTTSLVLDPMGLLAFISAGFMPMNEMFERAAMSERDIWNRTKAVFEYFSLPFDAPPPD